MSSNGLTETRKSIHSSIPGHWSTELAVLDVLERRSRSQHRHQIFLQRLRHVIRLGRDIGSQLKLEKGESTSDLLRLCFKTALKAAGVISTQMIHLRHFLPLQTALMAAYSRLHAITLAYTSHTSSPASTQSASAINLDMSLVGEVPNVDSHATGSAINSEKDLGERMERATAQLDESMTRPVQSDPIGVAPRKKKIRKKDAMDDIFGF